jgi:phosphohistidine phosphatase
MRLYLVRHAEAAPGDPDELRPLTLNGRQAARQLGERLREEAGRVDAVLTSPLLRARQTGEAIARALELEAESNELLAPGTSEADLLAAVEGRGAVVVAVAHQPDCSRIAAALSGGPEPPFPPGGLVRLDLPE